MYLMEMAGAGHAAFVMRDSVVVGADATGGVLDGVYMDADAGKLDVSDTRVTTDDSFVISAISGGESKVWNRKSQECCQRIQEMGDQFVLGHKLNLQMLHSRDYEIPHDR